MAEGQYCIVDVTIDASLPVEGLVGMTIEVANEWIIANQVELSEPTSDGFTGKYSIQPDNWPEVVE